MITGVLSRISVYQMHKRLNALRNTQPEGDWLFLLAMVALLARLLAFGPEFFVDWSLLRAQHGVDIFDASQAFHENVGEKDRLARREARKGARQEKGLFVLPFCFLCGPCVFARH